MVTVYYLMSFEFCLSIYLSIYIYIYIFTHIYIILSIRFVIEHWWFISSPISCHNIHRSIRRICLRARLHHLNYYDECVSRFGARMHFIFRQGARTLRSQCGKPVVRLLIVRCIFVTTGRRPWSLPDISGSPKMSLDSTKI